MTVVMFAPSETRNSCRMNGSSATAEHVLATCLRLELEAAALYRRFQAAASTPELADLWKTMSREEAHHADLIDQLAIQRAFVVPTVSWTQLTALGERVDVIRQEADVDDDLSDDRMLAITAALEFSEMDDLFIAICKSAGLSPDAGRADHLTLLVQAVLTRKEGNGTLRHLLAAMIRLRRRDGSTDTEARAGRLSGLIGR
jgi:hypothetical protein